MPREMWNHLMKDANDKWGHAITVSDAAGHPYFNRAGESVNPEKDKDSIVHRALLGYARRANKAYE